MRRLLILLLLAACLMPEAGPVQAQATTDQLNKLSLEALTTPAPGGNPGPSYRARSYRGSSIHRSGYARSGYRRARHYGGASGRSYRRSAYHSRGYHTLGHHVGRSRHAVSSGSRRSMTGRRHSARHAAYHRRRRAAVYQQGTGYAPGAYALHHGH